MKSLQELAEIRDRMKGKVSLREGTNEIRIVVGMATCGIAAGAKPVYNAIREALAVKEIADVSLISTGCIGVCRLEPIVEIVDASGEKTTYIRMDADKAKRVVEEHIIGGQVCSDLVIGAAEG